MAWIESHQELARHPKTKKLARKLGTTIPAVIGHLHLFWWWAMDYAADGYLSKFDPEDLADAAAWEDDSQSFMDALLESGFIDLTEDGVYTIHNWHKYVGKLLEKRALDAERKKNSRRHKDVLRTSNGQPTDGAGNRTVPNLTVPNLTEPNREQQIGAHEDENQTEDDSTSAAYSETIVDVYSKVFGGLTLNPLIAEHIKELLLAGMSEETIKEILLEVGESSTRPNLKLMKSISARWLKEQIKSREESMSRKGAAAGGGTRTKGRSNQKPVIPVVQSRSDPPREFTSDEREQMNEVIKKLGGTVAI